MILKNSVYGEPYLKSILGLSIMKSLSRTGSRVNPFSLSGLWDCPLGLKFVGLYGNDFKEMGYEIGL